jgi:hypothetical protein
MQAVILEVPEKHWECPSCGIQHVTKELRPHTPMHNCKSLNGLVAPYVEVIGSELKKNIVRHRLIEREDYVGKEIVRTDANGRPFTAIYTERSDGSNDCHAFAGTAQAQTD